MAVPRSARELAQTALLALALFLALQSVAQAYRVEQRSMEPTLRDGQYLVVYRLAYVDVRAEVAADLQADLATLAGGLLSAPTVQVGQMGIELGRAQPGLLRRGDIVVLRHPRLPGQHLIKRVVALPGETVEVRGGRVVVGGVPLDEPYLARPPSYVLPPQIVRPDDVFVLGDNRDASYDSHVFGPVPSRLIVGRAYPLPSFALPHFALPRPADGSPVRFVRL